MKVTYDSNNSGGSWWLDDKAWKALEEAGWAVDWRDSRWMGCLADKATIDCETPGDAMRSFEKATGQDVMDEGCNCCGAPHCFTWGEGDNYGYVSGEECATYLFPGKKKRSLREMIERE